MNFTAVIVSCLLAFGLHMKAKKIVLTAPLAKTYYAATTGTDGAAGTIADPLSLTKAVSSTSPAVPGDTIIVRAGTYGTGSSYALGLDLGGTIARRVTVKAYPGERAVVNGSLLLRGNYVDLRNIEIYNSNATTRTNTSTDLPLGLWIAGHDCRVINCVVHDTGAPGIWWPTTAGTSEIYGCVIWGCGLYQTDGGFGGAKRGPNIYGQNTSGTRTVRENFISKSWTEGMKAYSETGYAEGFVYTNNVAFMNDMDGYIIDTLAQSVTSFSMLGNHSYLNNYDRVGDTAITRGTAVLGGNTFVNDSSPYHIQLYVHGWSTIRCTNNLFVDVTTDKTGSPNANDTLVWYQIWTTNNPTATIDYNAFWGGSDIYGHWYTNSTDRLTFALLQSTTPYEAHGVSTTNAAPTSNVITIWTNRYETGRANVVVWNWEGLDSTSINLSTTGLTNGQPYEIRDVQDWLGTPLVSSTYNSGSPSVSVALNSTSVTAILGTQTHMRLNPNVHTPKLFNGFVVLPTYL